MNKLLPGLNEIIPIMNPNNTFYDCGFNNDFELLSVKQKLQIVCDIVRQTILPNRFPNPYTESDDLVGNCHTACLVAMEYLKELKLCKNIKYVMARKRKFDPDDIVSIHGLLLIEGQDNNIYQFDPAPYVGYKFGRVDEIDNPFYEEYVEINNDMLFFLNTFKEILYFNSINSLDLSKINFYIETCFASLEYKILNGYCGNALKALLKYIDDVKLKDRISELIKVLRPYSKNNIENKNKQKELVNNQVRVWQEELHDLISSNKQYERQLELGQNIVQELKMLYPEYEIRHNIFGNNIQLSFINPRLLYELGLNTIMIKTSAYFLGYQDFIRDSFIKKYNSTGEYITNLAMPTLQTGLKPMLFSHPLGEKCIRSLTGESSVLLIEADPQSTLRDKKYLRELLCSSMWNKEIIWKDGKPITWDPFVTNLIHGTDNSCEAALHYVIANPEHQNMTRFMYPNPRLVYKMDR